MQLKDKNNFQKRKKIRQCMTAGFSGSDSGCTLFFEQCLNFIMRIDHGCNRNIVIDRCNEVSCILGNIDLMEPRTLQKRRHPVGQTGTEDRIEHTVFICLIKFLKAVCEQAVGCIGNGAGCAAVFEILREIEH